MLCIFQSSVFGSVVYYLRCCFPYFVYLDRFRLLRRTNRNNKGSELLQHEVLIQSNKCILYRWPVYYNLKPLGCYKGGSVPCYIGWYLGGNNILSVGGGGGTSTFKLYWYMLFNNTLSKLCCNLCLLLYFKN